MKFKELSQMSWARSSEELGFGKEAFSALYNHFKELFDFSEDVTECDVVNHFEGFKNFICVNKIHWFT